MNLQELWLHSLKEDRAQEDVTTKALVEYLKFKQQKLPVAHFRIVAREAGVFSGVAWAHVSAQTSNWKIINLLKEGSQLSKGTVAIQGEASVETLLAIERSLLNGLQHACGVATQTNQCVKLVNEAFEQWSASEKKTYQKPGVYHTRKTLPGLRELVLTAVQAGGGFEHRKTMSDRILAKDNHKDCLREAGQHYADWAQWVVSQHPNAMFEVDSLEELKELVPSGAKYFLLDNFSPAQIREAVALKRDDFCFEVSGGLNFENLKNYVIPGIDRLSLGSITHSVKSLDLGLDW